MKSHPCGAKIRDSTPRVDTRSRSPSHGNIDARRTPVIDPVCEKTYHVMGDDKTLAARCETCSANAGVTLDWDDMGRQGSTP